MSEVPTKKLNTGASIPAIGFGTWKLDDGNEVIEAVTQALQIGYRLIDTAKLYGNERGVGEAIRRSDVPREEIFVTTKLWSSDLDYESAFKAFEESKRNLRLDYIDLYLIHWPASELRHDAWKALTEIYEHGDAKVIGVSNYTVQHLEELLARSSLVPAVNQIEFHPFNYDQQAPILDFCKVHGIIVEAYSPLAQAHQLNHPVILQIAKKHGKSAAQVMLRWAIQHDTVPIPKSAHPKRIRENFEVYDFELTDQEMKTLNRLGSGLSVIV